MIKIKYQKYQFIIKAKDALLLPYYKGSTFRGAFGNAFRRIVCALKRNDCADCLLKEKCIYAYVFETSPEHGDNIMGIGKYEKIPHPFIIEPPEETTRTYRPDDELSFGLVLIGKALNYLPYFIYTFDELGTIGLGKGRGEYTLQKVLNDDKVVYDCSSRTLTTHAFKELNIEDLTDRSESEVESVGIRFITPARIKYNRDLVVKPEFHILIRNLLRRIRLISYFHCSDKDTTLNHKGYIERALSVKIKNNSTRWADWERYSTRQQTRMKMGGFVGEVEYIGHIKPFNSILETGEILHIGKGTSFGLGKYEIIA